MATKTLDELAEAAATIAGLPAAPVTIERHTKNKGGAVKVWTAEVRSITHTADTPADALRGLIKDLAGSRKKIADDMAKEIGEANAAAAAAEKLLEEVES